MVWAPKAHSRHRDGMPLFVWSDQKWKLWFWSESLDIWWRKRLITTRCVPRNIQRHPSSVIIFKKLRDISRIPILLPTSKNLSSWTYKRRFFQPPLDKLAACICWQSALSWCHFMLQNPIISRTVSGKLRGLNRHILAKSLYRNKDGSWLFHFGRIQ